MRRLALLPLLLTACTNDTVQGVPSIAVGLDADSVIVNFAQQPDHTFDATLAVNGVAAPAPDIDPGHIPPPNTSPFADQPAPAVATFKVPLAALSGVGAQIVLDDGGDHYVVDVPQLLATRALNVAMPATLHDGDTVRLDTGVPGDVIQSLAEMDLGSQDCADAYGDGALVMPVFADAWRCDPMPAAGTTIATTLAITADVTARIATCDGPDLTCEPIGLAQLSINTSATLAF